MRFPVRHLLLALLPLTIACGGGEGSTPTSPSAATPSAPTRIISVSGNLAFGDVPVGSQRELSYTITNSGNATLTVTGTTVSGGLVTHTTASWTSGDDRRRRVANRHGALPAHGRGQLQRHADGERGPDQRLQHHGHQRQRHRRQRSGQLVRTLHRGAVRRHRLEPGLFLLDQSRRLPAGIQPADQPESLAVRVVGVGHISFGQVTGSVNGTVNSAGTLVLQGTAVGGQITVALSGFNVSVNGSSMTGNFTYNAGLVGIPGVAVVTSRLDGVTKR